MKSSLESIETDQEKNSLKITFNIPKENRRNVGEIIQKILDATEQILGKSGEILE